MMETFVQNMIYMQAGIRTSFTYEFELSILFTIWVLFIFSFSVSKGRQKTKNIFVQLK